MKDITIFGSCVSRDAFDGLSSNRYKVVNNVQRNPIKTLVYHQMLLEEKYFPQDNSWRSRMLRCAFDKSALDSLGKVQSDYVIVDFVEDRLPIFIIRQGQLISAVAKYAETETLIEKLAVDNSYFITVEQPFALSEESLKQSAKYFVSRLTDFFAQEKIIINRAFLCREYLDDDLSLRQLPEQDYISRVNLHLRKLYSYIEGMLPRSPVIKMPQNTLADKYHRWGLAATHFEATYYQYLIKAVDIVTKSNENNTLENLFMQESLANNERRALLGLLKSKKNAAQ